MLGLENGVSVGLWVLFLWDVWNPDLTSLVLIDYRMPVSRSLVIILVIFFHFLKHCWFYDDYYGNTNFTIN